MRMVVVTIAALLLAAGTAAPQLRIDLEAGAAFSGYNDVRIPGDTGTQFSLTDDLETDPTAVVRARIEYTFGRRHTVSGLWAPLTASASGRPDRQLVFADEEFPAGTDLDAEYQFNSYRLTYRYEFGPGERFQAGLGLTAKVRDAAIRIEGGGVSAEKTDVGLVPLLNFRLRWALTDRLVAIAEGDALAAPQGRAEDVLVALVYRATDAVEVRLGYRLLEGGADNDEVYNFTLLNYAVLGVSITL
jgi:hypothetical protein